MRSETKLHRRGSQRSFFSHNIRNFNILFRAITRAILLPAYFSVHSENANFKGRYA